MRDQIRCPQETKKRVEAKTFLQLFANKWHDQPEPSSASDLQRAGILKNAPAIAPSAKTHGVGEDSYVEVLALIGADGKVVEAYVVCSTAMDLHEVALTAVLGSTYTPARVAGNPIASIVRRPYLLSSASH
ncbi:MAG TPA: hypothetical protein VK660_06975 [Xanthomonadaceae bacterium]|nr:hypothetical protein [Xanthomonadaceae bacterium]